MLRMLACTKELYFVTLSPHPLPARPLRSCTLRCTVLRCAVQYISTLGIFLAETWAAVQLPKDLRHRAVTSRSRRRKTSLSVSGKRETLSRNRCTHLRTWFCMSVQRCASISMSSTYCTCPTLNCRTCTRCVRTHFSRCSRTCIWICLTAGNAVPLLVERVHEGEERGRDGEHAACGADQQEKVHERRWRAHDQGEWWAVGRCGVEWQGHFFYDKIAKQPSWCCVIPLPMDLFLVPLLLTPRW